MLISETEWPPMVAGRRSYGKCRLNYLTNFTMPSNDQELADRAREAFAKCAESWRDYVLIADTDPPRIVRVSPSLALLEIEDPTLAQACREFLIENGAQTFGSFEETESVYGPWPVAATSMTTYRSPAGFYTVDHPSDWRITRDENIVNILPPEGSGEVTISAFHGGGVSPFKLRGLFERVFENYKVISPLRAISQNNCDGLQAEYLQSVGKGFRSWLVIGAYYQKVMVLITANDTQEAMPSQRHIYESILNSLVLADPEEAKE